MCVCFWWILPWQLFLGFLLGQWLLHNKVTCRLLLVSSDLPPSLSRPFLYRSTLSSPMEALVCADGSSPSRDFLRRGGWWVVLARFEPARWVWCDGDAIIQKIHIYIRQANLKGYIVATAQGKYLVTVIRFSYVCTKHHLDARFTIDGGHRRHSGSCSKKIVSGPIIVLGITWQTN